MTAGVEAAIGAALILWITRFKPLHCEDCHELIGEYRGRHKDWMPRQCGACMITGGPPRIFRKDPG